MSDEKSKVSRKRVFLIIFIICIVIAVVAGICGIVYQVRLAQEEEEYSAILDANVTVINEVPDDVEETTPEPDEISEEVPELTEEMNRIIDFKTLQAETNADIYAWIYIPDTNIDYPVLQHPTDNSYYLNYNLDGTKGYPGCIYTEKENAKDFSDFNTVLYGHNMKNGTMFQNLHYFEDEDFFLKHPYVYIYLEDRTLQYEIFAAYKYNNNHLLKSFDYSTEEGREFYIEEIIQKGNSAGHIVSDVELSAESNILTLSTCIGNDADSRYLVQGVLVQDVDLQFILGQMAG